MTQENTRKFLCSHCETEQNVSQIEYEGMKTCLCPNCHEECCKDYCMFHSNGRWNDLDIGMFLAGNETHREQQEAASNAYLEAVQSQRARYEETRRLYEHTTERASP